MQFKRLGYLIETAEGVPKAKFLEFIKKGYKAYSVDSSGKKNRKIEEFDVDAEEILMIPQTAKG